MLADLIGRCSVELSPEDRTVRGLDDIDLPRCGTARLDDLRLHRDGLPTSRCLDVELAAGVPETLGVDVLVVPHCIRDRPGHRARVREVLDAGHSGEGESDDV